MRSSISKRGGGRKRAAAMLGAVALFAGLVAVAQVSSAQTRARKAATTAAQCTAPSAGARPAGMTTSWQNGREVRNYRDDGQARAADCVTTRATTAAADTGISCPTVANRLGTVPREAKAEVDRNLAELDTQLAAMNKRFSKEQEHGQRYVDSALLAPLASQRKATIDRMAVAIDRVAARPSGLDDLAKCKATVAAANNNVVAESAKPAEPAKQPNNGLNILGDSCAKTKLAKHDGLQKGNRCVDTEFGEVGNAANNPSLLITDAPETVKVGQAFTISVATRNLVRDRFLGAAAGGYYLESSFLNPQGLVRGHFHTACRMLSSEDNAPDPAPAPAFFVATEDGKGGKNSDTLKIQ
ncbi:MAG TPA: hypothetical protein VK453_23130, partial [Micromonosporaceae bacterium]|nr:hypothetical protein [Micromonosporaceae bacterium]